MRKANFENMKGTGELRSTAHRKYHRVGCSPHSFHNKSNYGLASQIHQKLNENSSRYPQESKSKLGRASFFLEPPYNNELHSRNPYILQRRNRSRANFSKKIANIPKDISFKVPTTKEVSKAS